MKKKTKIVATISDRNCSVELLTELYEAGMNVVRINSAHSTFEGATAIVENVRKVSDKIAILVDTKGPEIRSTLMEDGGFRVEIGETVIVKGTDKKDTPSSRECLWINDVNFAKEVPVGSSILIDDGEIELVVTAAEGDALVTEVRNGGVIKGKKSVNVPGVHIDLPSLTKQDVDYIHWAVHYNLDFIAHSFVRNKHDLIAIQNILDECDSSIKIVAKIENQEGVDNIDEILDYAYGVMVARGDLGVELPAEQIPITQRQLVKKCIESKKPVIIATQMLHSMIDNPRPTRAEVSDVANAIYQRVDAIMLSGETANGKYPVEAIKTMTTIARRIEQEVQPIIDINMVRINNEITAQLSRSAVRASINLPIKAIIIDSLSGRTARYLSAFRGLKPVYAMCYRKHVMRELALSYGIEAQYGEPTLIHEKYTYKMLTNLERDGKLSNNDLICIIGGTFGPENGASYLEVGKVIHVINKTI
ncbi:Pyruvate kinase [Mucinivorans hirudinis]|uniref:Pyruvate kinase n=1 Tax=Mucinivorans hirudinis TaxID=1433126 RepID=A0A060R985_9BACT|nr:Pyruvate kinase [Mucinivorans hirudinis]